MTKMINRQWVLTSRPKGLMSPENFTYYEVDVPSVEDGDILVRNTHLSFEPAQQRWATEDGYIPASPLNEPFRSLNVAQVVESKHHEFKAGDLVFCSSGWQDYCLLKPDAITMYRPEVLPDGLDPKLANFFYSTGLAGYYGMLKIGRPKKGDIVHVTSAAGSVGMIASQVAKLHGAHVYGSVSNQEKCDWLMNVAKLDGVINYKDEDLDQRMSELYPDGIDIFFDTVGGRTLEIALNHLKRNGCVVVCAAISQMKALGQDRPQDYLYGIKNLPLLTVLRGRAEGFIDMDYFDTKPEDVAFLRKCVDEGSIKVEYDMQEGFDNIPAIPLMLFDSKNLGKLMMQINAVQ